MNACEGYAFYEAKKLKKFCSKKLEQFSNRREERLKEEINSLIERKKRLSKKWFGFLIKVPTEKEAEKQLKSDGGLFSTYEDIMMMELGVLYTKELVCPFRFIDTL